MIAHVAFKMPDGEIVSMPRPNRHHNIIHLLCERGTPRPVTAGATQGFLLPDGTFADRTAAGCYALRVGQIKVLKFHNKELFSEDLW